MYDYMMSLQKYFSLPLECEELEQQIKVQCCQLREHLNQQDRRTLLRLIDLEIELRDKAALNSFFSGFRLATGIHQELMSYPPHGFDAEEEKQAIQEGGDGLGKTQTIGRRHGPETGRWPLGGPHRHRP